MARIGRRTFLKLSGGATAAATGTSGIAAILATGRAPAHAQQTTVHWLRWNDFVPASDQLLRRELLPEAEKALGIKVIFETVNGNDLQPRVTASVQSPCACLRPASKYGAPPSSLGRRNNSQQVVSR
jgi:multiple sugar transport system substrate-binding protein